MRRVLRTLGLAGLLGAVLPLATGCQGSPTDTPPCMEPPMPLSAYCHDPCPNFDAFVAQVRSMAEQPPSGGMTCMEGFVGTCGDMQVASYYNGLYGPRGFFQSDGTLVGVRYRTDVLDAAGCSTIDYGTVPQCDPTVTEDICHPMNASDMNMTASDMNMNG